jgi:hypothetical protein
MNARAALPALLVAVALLIGVGALALRAAAGGEFVYPLDDPYIHLGLADGIRNGFFGLFVDQPAAPSSSWLWPFALAPWTALPGATFAPLALATVASLALTVALWRGVGLALGPGHTGARTLGVALLLAASQAVSLALTGMEHTLQTACVAWMAVGLLETERDGRAPAWLPWALGLAPLVRYECVGVSALTAAALAARGHARAAAGWIPGLLALTACSAYLLAHTGFWLPNSVLSKRAMFSPAWRDAWQPALSVPGALAAVGLAHAARAGRGTFEGRAIYPALALAAVMGHLAFGQLGIFYRYTAYLVPWVALLLLGYARDALRADAAAGAATLRPWAWAGLLLALPGLRSAASLPDASAHVAAMHGGLRALSDAIGTLAVHDVGRLGWRNPHGALDLIGLSNTDALRHQLAHDDPAWMAEMVREHDAKLIALFPSWFPATPPEWVPIGELAVARSAFGDDHASMTLWAPSPSEAPGLRTALEAARPSLPPGAALTLRP